MKLDGILLAFQLFSTLPVKKKIELKQENIRQALLFLPFLGGLMGGITAFMIYLARLYLTSFMSSVLGLLTYFILSGGLHLDGLADMADGFLAGKNRERTIEIMHDASIGMYGFLSLISYSLLKIALFDSLDSSQLHLIPLATTLSRLSVLFVIVQGDLGPSAGFGQMMKEALETHKKVIYLYFFAGWLILAVWSWTFLLVALFQSLLSQGILAWSNKKIGGLSGDVYGAVIELQDIGGLFLFMILT